jgi:hypothetical protein
MSEIRTATEKPKDRASKEELERWRSVQVARPGVVRGKDIWDLSTLHGNRRRRAR